MLTFIYKRKAGLAGFVYHMVMRFILGNDIIRKVVVYSQSEVDYYSSVFPHAKDKFVPLAYAIDYLPEIADNEELRKERYIFATGRSNRNYQFLVDMLSGTGYKVKIACKGLNVGHGDNVEIMQNVFGAQMFEYMANCHIVAIPLSDLNVSSGQLVLLQAMQLGKPIVITDNSTVADYIDNGRTGYIVENNEAEWMEKIDLLYNDAAMYAAISNAEKEDFRKRFSVDRFVCDVARLVANDLR